MIKRRSFLKYGAGASVAAMSSANLWAKQPVAPKRAVFIFIPMGEVNSTWNPVGCQSISSGGDLMSPFASVEDRCLVPGRVQLETSGFGLPYRQLIESPWELGADSLDTLIGSSPGLTASVPGGHLRLCAKEADSNVGYGVSIASGNILPLGAYVQDPQNLFNQLEAHGLPENFGQNNLLELDSSVDSLSTWKIKNFFELTKVALQTGYSKSVTFMIGDDDADVMAPPSLDLSYYETLRMYTPQGRPQDFIKFKAYLHQLVADFIADLAVTIDLDGEPLLDSTLIYLFSNMGNGDHYGSYGAPTLLAGADQSFRTGSVFSAYTGVRPILNAISYAFFGKRGLVFGDDVAFNLLRY